MSNSRKFWYFYAKVTTTGLEISDFRFRQRFRDFSQDFQRFQPETYEISRSEQPLGTDSFHSGPLRPGTQHTSTPLTDNHHNMFRWQQPRRVKVSDDLNQRGLSWKVNRAGLRVYRRLKSHRHRTLRTDIHTNRSWAELVKFCTSEKDSNMPTD